MIGHSVAMCGISGAVSITPGVAGSAIDAQLACQRHRGPDAEGRFGSGPGVIAQNRLAIIDLAEGDPPISNEDGTVGAVLNGEIYNFGELREGLLQSGHAFRSHGDTEVIAHLAEDHDAVGLASKLNGMFAFAVWDSRREQLILGRDRLGKKPLYYWSGAGTFVFASEIKGVLAHPAVPRELNDQAISAYLTFGYVPTPYTFYAGIRSLPPAHTLRLEPGREPRLERYWQLKLLDATDGDGAGCPSFDMSLDEAADEVRHRLEAAIRRRLIADVPLGAFLSGGVDSSAIVALTAGLVGQPVQTFAVGFEDRDGFDERPYARVVAKRFGTDHHEELVHPDAIELIERLVWHHDQPFGDSSAIPTFLLSEVARRHVTVALSGDGGDELFGGYERFAAGLAIDRLARVPAPALDAGERLIAALPAGSLWGRSARLQRFAAAVHEGMPGAYRRWVSYVPPERRDRLLRGPNDHAHDEYADLWRASAGAGTLSRLLALNLDTYLLDDLLVKTDRMSMAHGLEVRSPFLDVQLLEFATRLPPDVKIRGLSLKRVLKRAVADLLPKEILSRRKHGFGVPLDRWFREDLASYSAGMLGPGAHVRRRLDGDELDRILAEHVGRTQNHGHTLWTLLTLELFLRRRDW
jgi:asparagine synthase (glutamine-hydrolysing)